MVSSISILLKKTVRDIFTLLGPALVLSCVMAAGLSSFIMAQSNLVSLQESQKITYQKLQYADALIPLVRIPRESVQRLSKIRGIVQVDCRLSESGQVRLAKEKRQILARFHSLPAEDALNRLKVVEGMRPTRNSMNEALLSDAFARAWKIRSGDLVDVLIRGKSFKFKIAGLVRSAEYIYQTGSATSIPDDKLFSAWWIHPRILEQTSHLQSSCNEILLSVSDDSTLRKASTEISAILKPYGFTQIITRKKQLSHYFLESELDQLRAMSLYMPALFISVALFLLNITMTRILLTQRESLATLRAFGFERRTITIHALLLAFGCLIPGLILGLWGGFWMSEKMFEVYIKFYRFAYTVYQPDLSSVGLSLLMCLATALFGSLRGLINIYKEVPAQALVPAAPAHTRATSLDSLPVLQNMSLLTRMSLRNIFRRPFQSTITLLGLMLATALLLFARFEEYAIVQMMDTEFNETQRQSHTLLFTDRLPFSATRSVSALLPRGIAEASLVLPVTLKLGPAERELTLIVKAQPETLRHLENIPVRSLAQSGIVISKSLADALKISPPQKVTLLTRDRKPSEVIAEITDLSENLMGTIATLSPEHFAKIFHVSRSFNTILFKAERNAELDTPSLFVRLPTLFALSEKNFEKKAFEKTMAENIGIFRNVMIAFALLIAIGVVYNNARIQFSEREREFALLRALGFAESELTLLFWLDYILLTGLAILPGLWLGQQILEIIMRALETEVFRIPVIITLQSYFWAATMLWAGVILTAAFIQPRIHKIAFLAILKTRE